MSRRSWNQGGNDAVQAYLARLFSLYGVFAVYITLAINVMFEGINRERDIRRALRAVARQRVVMVLPGDFPVIEQSPPDAEWFDVAIRTCHIRGWVEVLHEALPTGQLRFEESRPVFPSNMKAKNHYRLTEAGWAALNRSHAWVLSFAVAAATLAATILSVLLSLKG